MKRFTRNGLPTREIFNEVWLEEMRGDIEPGSGFEDYYKPGMYECKRPRDRDWEYYIYHDKSLSVVIKIWNGLGETINMPMLGPTPFLDYSRDVFVIKGEVMVKFPPMCVNGLRKTLRCEVLGENWLSPNRIFHVLLPLLYQNKLKYWPNKWVNKEEGYQNVLVESDTVPIDGDTPYIPDSCCWVKGSWSLEP